MGKVIVSIKDLNVKFMSHGTVNSVIKNISLDIYENETLAIVGESGSGKSVLTRTFTNIIERNGFITNGSINYYGKMPNLIGAHDEQIDLTTYHYHLMDGISRSKVIKLYKKEIKEINDLLLKDTINEDAALLKEKIQQLQQEMDKFINSKPSWFKPNLYAKDICKIRGGVIANIFQDPMTSLNPLLSVGQQISWVLKLHQGLSNEEAKATALKLLDKVGIINPEKAYKTKPIDFSGGMKQRVVIAIALAANPKILVADEPTTALDVTIQKQILKLITDLKNEFKFTIIFITHDLSVVANIADRIAVMYCGQVIEYGTKDDIFTDPRHPYTWALLSSLPQLASKNETLYMLQGSPPSLSTAITGDPFAPRNEYALAIDFKYDPPFFKVSDSHYAKTWLLDERAKKINVPKKIVDLQNLIKKGIH